MLKIKKYSEKILQTKGEYGIIAKKHKFLESRIYAVSEIVSPLSGCINIHLFQRTSFKKGIVIPDCTLL